MVIFNDRIADVAERFLRKGRKVYVEGALQTRKWTDKDGAEKYTTEVVIGRFRGELTLLDSQRDEAGEGGGYAAAPCRGAAGAAGRQRRRGRRGIRARAGAIWMMRFRSDGGPGGGDGGSFTPGRNASSEVTVVVTLASRG